MLQTADPLLQIRTERKLYIVNVYDFKERFANKKCQPSILYVL